MKPSQHLCGEGKRDRERLGNCMFQFSSKVRGWGAVFSQSGTGLPAHVESVSLPFLFHHGDMVWEHVHSLLPGLADSLAEWMTDYFLLHNPAA